MKLLYIPALFLVVYIATSGQTKSINTAKAKVIVIKPEIKPQIKLTDTLKINLSSNSALIPIDANRGTQIVILKEKESSDTLKTLLPLVFALTGLIFGFLLNRFYDYYSNRKNIKKSGKRWVIQLITIKETIKQQIKAIEEFLSSLKKEEWMYDSLVFITTIEGDIFTSLDKNDLLDYIESNNKSVWYKRIFMSKEVKANEYQLAVKISNRTHGFISTLAHHYSLLFERFNTFNDGVSNSTKKFNDDLEVLRKQMNELNFQVMNGVEKIYEDAEYSKILDLFVEFKDKITTDPNFNPLNSDRTFLEPAVKALTKLTKDKRILPITDTIATLFGDMRAIKAEREYIISNMEELMDRYKYSLTTIDIVTDNIIGKETKQGSPNNNFYPLSEG